jgi:D-psicose/D-tagatose/L-ribulose 3-epimerase
MKFEPILRTLRQMQAQGHYGGVVAVEPFDYVPDGPGCAARSIGYLKGIAESLERDA